MAHLYIIINTKRLKIHTNNLKILKLKLIDVLCTILPV